MPTLTPDELARYSRHILLPEIGVEGQTRLRAARVLIVGAGGLGSPAALYLAAAGVGTLGIADFDQVETHNLHRQLLHRDASVGQPKVASAARHLRELNPHLTVIEHPDGVTPDNAVAMFAAYDVVVDGTDNFNSRYLNSDAAVRAERPLVFGSVYRFEGQVTVFAPHRQGPCYRCLFPEPPPRGSVPGCGEVGVLGALCGVIGGWMALETIKWVTGCGEPLVGRLLLYDALAQQVTSLPYTRQLACSACGPGRCDDAPPGLAAEPELAQVDKNPVPLNMSAYDYPLEISVRDAQALLGDSAARVRLIDVREPYEWEICHVPSAQHLPMRQIPEQAALLPRDEHLLVMCHHGGRSMRVTEYLRAQGFTAVSNISGGIDAWAREIDPTLRRY